MNRASLYLLRRKIIPLAVVGIIAVAVVVSLNDGAQSSNESFAFRVAWPSPGSYVPNNPQPNVYLQINYTGTGLRSYDYLIVYGSSVLANGTVVANSKSPSSIYTFSPVPANLQARVFEAGRLVYVQNLTLG